MLAALMMLMPKEFRFDLAPGNSDLRTAALAAGWSGTAKVVATLPAGVDLANGLTVSGAFPAGVRLNIASGAGIYGGYGNGGNGGYGSANTGLTGGSAGGTALAVTVACTVDNLGILAGGGGGGGGGAGGHVVDWVAKFGGDGGHGRGYVGTQELGAAGQDGACTGAGGTGGGFGTAGESGSNGQYWNGSSWVTTYGAAGGAAGKSVSGNANITWINTGSRVGPIA